MLDRGVLTYNISLGRSPQLLGRASKKKKNIQGKIKTCGRPFSDRLTLNGVVRPPNFSTCSRASP